MIFGNVTKGQVFRYMVLPGFKPRIMALLSSGFQFIAFYIAQVYMLVRLLPANHPYTNPANIGRFGIRHVIAEAANSISFSRNHLDQVFVFFVILFGLIIGVVQLALLGLSFAFAPAMAAIPSFVDFFKTPNPEQDIANMLMDLVFGVPGIFNSCVSAGGCMDLNNEQIGANAVHTGSFLGGLDPSSTIPFAIHDGLHQMFQLYSFGLLVVAVFLTIYFVFVVLSETAQTGTPFGKRFNKVWAPLRIVVAFGLLIPIGAHGLNTSQYLVLYAAKFGSAFATNGWILFNDTLTGTYAGETERLLTESSPPNLGSLIQFLFAARTCQFYEMMMNNRSVYPYLVRSQFHSSPNLQVSLGTSYDNALNFGDGSSVLTLRFGVEDEKENAMYKGFVKPLCGELQFQVSQEDLSGPKIIEAAYWEIIKKAYFQALSSGSHHQYYVDQHTDVDAPWASAPSDSFAQSVLDQFKDDIQPNAIDNAIATMAADGSWDGHMNELKNRGWGGAAIWYNKIAEMNGALTNSILKAPAIAKYPEIMEQVQARRAQVDKNIVAKDRFKPGLANEGSVFQTDTERNGYAKALNEAYSYWGNVETMNSSHTSATGNSIVDMINALFGTSGIFDMRKNKDKHPLAQLSGIGRGLVQASIENIGLVMAGGVGGSLLTVVSEIPAQLIGVASGFMITIITISLTIGWVLFYVIPFLPFIYFFFAVVGWVKGIFEAMVGAPLWALAHIRIDGNGLPGSAAASGYFLLFEVFLRPIIVVFGLLGSISIFAAMVQALNEIFDLVVQNVTGFSPDSSGAAGTVDMAMFRGPIDEFVFTLIYAVIVYLMAMSSFKLIDHVPNQILRWMGQSVTTFNDERQDPAGGLMQTSWAGGQQLFQHLGGGMQSMASLGKAK